LLIRLTGLIAVDNTCRQLRRSLRFRQLCDGSKVSTPPVSQLPTPDATLVSTSLTASKAGTVSVEVTCPPEESTCMGTITLRTLNPVTENTTSRQASKRILTLASGSFTVAGGKVTTAKLHLSGQAHKLLARTHALHARATIIAHDPLGATHTTLTIVTLRAARATHGHV
jgi:hypothetical protein